MEQGFTKQRMNEIGNLNKNEVRIIAVRPTKSDSVQAVFLQNIEREGRVNLTNRAMKGHEAFGNQSNARPFWITFTMEGIKDMFPELLEPAKQAKESGDYVSVDIKNPSVEGRKVCIQVTETHRARTSDINNLEQSAKQDGEGNYLSKNGLAIFERAILTFQDVAQHSFIEHDRSALTPDINDLDFETSSYTPVELEEEKADQAQSQNKEIVDEEEPEAEKQPA